MLETPHVFIGAAIAAKIPNPFIAIPLAFASHFVMEMVPHWNPHLNSETEKYGAPTRRSTVITAIDSTLALASGSFMAYQALPNVGHAVLILACSFAAVLPDVMEGPYFFLRLRTTWIKKWIAFQKSIQSDTTVFWGLLTQLLTIAAVIFWLRN
ncbi:MAG: hypothetical protein NTZ07_03120 [Candidatus Woesebacteria bacterium]|nr:hypothetical protein [Candidatus Woesebacteria bacterium]